MIQAIQPDAFFGQGTGIAAGVGVAARLTVMLTLLGLVCMATNSVTLPDGYPAITAKQLATEVKP